MKPEDIKHWRLSLGLTQQQAADELGMTREGYQLLEYGRRAISRRTALACAALERGLEPYVARSS